MKNSSRNTMRLPRHDERFLVSLNGSPVAQYHQDTFIYIRKAVRADLRQNEYLSLDMKNIPKNIIDFKKEVLRALEINYMVEGEDWRLRKLENFELFKIENDLDVWYLKNFDKIEAVYQPREDNIVRVKSLVEEDKSSESKWGKFSGGQKLGRN